jgi:hypothetical protein
MRRAFFLLAVALTAACAARSPVSSLATVSARADELIRQGCYDCLLDARALYAGVPAAARRPVLPRIFEVELLLALREKELALDETATMARAAAIAAELGPFDSPDAPGAGPAANASRYLAIVDAVPADETGTPRVARRLPPIVAGRGERDAYLAETFSVLRGSALTPIVREYIELAVVCEIASDRAPARNAPATTSPLLLYRRAICGNPIDATALEQVRAAVPRFAEASLFLGRSAMSTLVGSDGSRVRMLLEDAYARFPDSPAVTLHLATVAQATGDCRRAESFFTETLVLRERHESARLGRAICRTYLSNIAGAIADTDVLIESSAYNRADAHYWRAWNRRARKELASARTDIESARALLYNARVLTLAGMIEHDQQEFDKAREDLTRAREMDSRECQARWYLGLVGYGTEQWEASAAGFADAADCYAGQIAETERQRDAMAKRDDVSEEFRARQIAGFNAAIAEDTSQKSAADLNAAINYARAGNVEQATTYMKRAAVDPERRTIVEDLRQVLGVPRW